MLREATHYGGAGRSIVGRMNLDVLESQGFAHVSEFVDRAAAVALRELYPDDTLFRSRIVMERHRFGRGEYKYFRDPLPPAIEELRERLYGAVLPVAQAWSDRLRLDVSYPPTLREWLERCHAQQQRRPTPLLLKYGPGDYNCLHQDLYGPVAFPLQATVYLSRPDEEFGGGQVVLTEQRPRSQTRPYVVEPRQGDLLVLPTGGVPRAGKNGAYRALFKHGVSTVEWGERYTLGIIFHDAL